MKQRVSSQLVLSPETLLQESWTWAAAVADLGPGVHAAELGQVSDAPHTALCLFKQEAVPVLEAGGEAVRELRGEHCRHIVLPAAVQGRGSAGLRARPHCLHLPVPFLMLTQ